MHHDVAFGLKKENESVKLTHLFSSHNLFFLKQWLTNLYVLDRFSFIVWLKDQASSPKAHDPFMT